MRTYVCAPLVVITLVACASALLFETTQHFAGLLNHVRQNACEIFLQNYHSHSRLQTAGAAPTCHTLGHWEVRRVQQLVNHFDTSAPVAWQQRYFVNTDFVRNWQTAPIFIYIGGQGQLTGASVTSGSMVQFAHLHNGFVCALEHRFYGESQPTNGDLSWESLDGRLTVEQALDDVGIFILHLYTNYPFNATNPVILFGGGYGGTIAAYANLKNKVLVFLSLAYGAPTRGLAENTGYNNIVSSALKDDTLGGSGHCYDRVKDGFTEFDDLLKVGWSPDDESKFWLLDNFKLCNYLTSRKDINLFAAELNAVFMSAVQFNGFLEDNNVRQVCQVMIDTRSYPKALEALAALNRRTLNITGAGCLNVAYDALVDRLERTRASETSFSRQLLFQRCYEIGIFATCAPQSSCVLSHLINRSAMMQLCAAVFPKMRTTMSVKAKELWQRYGTQCNFPPPDKRLMFSIGLNDPFTTVTVYSDRRRDDNIWTAGMSHLEDMADFHRGESPAAAGARLKAHDRVAWFLKHPDQFTRKRSDAAFKEAARAAANTRAAIATANAGTSSVPKKKRQKVLKSDSGDDDALFNFSSARSVLVAPLLLSVCGAVLLVFAVLFTIVCYTRRSFKRAAGAAAPHHSYSLQDCV